MKQQMEKRKEYDQKLKSILTDKQYKKFQEQHKRGPRGGRHGGPRGPRAEMQD
jgi:Spy/CpxP family protein refolding chaperone